MSAARDELELAAATPRSTPMMLTLTGRRCTPVVSLLSSGVADGDTITVLDADRQQHKIRLQGIDAPEKAQPFGQRSKESMSTLVFGKDVRVEWEKRDKYKRIVGKVWVQPASCPTCPMTLDAGHAQITVGWPGGIGNTATNNQRRIVEPTSFQNRKRGRSVPGCGLTLTRCRPGIGGSKHADEAEGVAGDG
jgi:hypothetical protein